MKLDEAKYCGVVLSVIIDTSATAAANCVGVVRKGALVKDSPENLDVMLMSDFEYDWEDGSLMKAFALW